MGQRLEGTCYHVQTVFLLLYKKDLRSRLEFRINLHFIEERFQIWMRASPRSQVAARLRRNTGVCIACMQPFCSLASQCPVSILLVTD